MAFEGRSMRALTASEILGYQVINAKHPSSQAQEFANHEIGLLQNNSRLGELPYSLSDGVNYGEIVDSGNKNLDNHMVVGIPVGRNNLALLLVPIQ